MSVVQIDSTLECQDIPSDGLKTVSVDVKAPCFMRSSWLHNMPWVPVPEDLPGCTMPHAIVNISHRRDISNTRYL